MRFVDEYRDAEKARALAARIAELCEPGRSYKFMEICVGHTHTIYKHGLEDYLPETITLVHGPGCPASAPNAPPSSCTTRTWSNDCAPKPMSAAMSGIASRKPCPPRPIAASMS
jgi:hydrogenase expression/formation protein HypD